MLRSAAAEGLEKKPAEPPAWCGNVPKGLYSLESPRDCRGVEDFAVEWKGSEGDDVSRSADFPPHADAKWKLVYKTQAQPAF